MRALKDLFEHTYIISLPDRRDRRRAMQRELDALRRDGLHLGAHFFDAVRPSEAGPFPSIGARGCFLSHLGVLRDAERRGWETILVLEDDAAFPGDFARSLAHLSDELRAGHYDVIQLGYFDHHGAVAAQAVEEEGQWGDRQERTPQPRLIQFRGEVTGAHCVVYSQSGVRLARAHLEALLEGPAGDRLHGPMHLDGALNTLAWVNPRAVRLVSVPSLVGQRASRSDITPSFHDRVRVARPALALLRRLAR